MFNVRPDTYVPGFRVRPPEVPGFRVGSNEETRHEFLASADDGVMPAFVIGPKGGGSGGGDYKCALMPGTQQFGFCLYRCPDGTVRRTYEVFGCKPWIFPDQGIGL
jgi:hypothetical protein